MDKILELILKLFNLLFGSKDAQASQAPVQLTQPEVPKQEIDWSNPTSKISEHFTVKEATYLNSWQVYHIPSESDKAAILGIAEKMDKVSTLLSQKLGKQISIIVHAWIRPEKTNAPGTQWNGQDYNKWIYWNEVWKGLTDAEKAAKHVPLSPHRTGHAIDFHIADFEGAEGCAKIREMVLPELESLGLRMEDINGSWVHLDDLPVINNRFFKP